MIGSVRFNARAITFAFALALPLSAQVSEGDRHYAARAEGASGAHAKAGPIDAAIAAYQRAVASAPNDLVARGRLLRAYRYKGAYVARATEEKRRVYATAKTAGNDALMVLSRLLTAKGVKPDAKESQVASAARAIPGAADVYLWDAINWGEWALVYGKLAAARQGAADRIRREATIAHLIDSALEGGAPSRVLGRLHDQTPRIPFLTGWASGKEAIRFLSESRRHDPANKLTLVFLAEATVGTDTKRKPEAVRMLRTVIDTPVHPEYTVEDAAAIEDAKRLLRKWSA